MTEEEQQQQVPLYTISADVVETSKKSSLSIFENLCHRLREHSGIWYMIAGNMIFACCTFALKLIPADMFDIMISRFLLQSIVFGLYAAFYKHYNIFNTNGQPIACTLNMIMSSGTNLTYLAAFYFLPLSDVNAIKYTYIVWAAILSVIFLKEHFKFVNAIALVLTIIGLILATKPQSLVKMLSHLFHQSILSTNATISTNITISTTTIMTSTVTGSLNHYLGILFAFISSLTKAIQMVARKQLIKTKLPHSVMNFQFTAFAFVVAVIYSIIRRFWHPEPYPWKWMCTAGIIIACFHLLSNTFNAKALKRENLQVLSILSTLGIVYACLLQYIFFRLTRPLMFYIGASFIVTSAIILSIDTYLTNRKRKERIFKE
ncbi:unnamed protein product [Rotaria sordida]|uniref:EamA domain-containing protein n=1 Tax=Rotaria sordida TaxID=392033 RepID=A0A815URL4_9BILA|nr:unnamed protein product [Rotaria sordida]CAF1663091.1 unnamed protein product [Rotaria sordida]